MVFLIKFVIENELQMRSIYKLFLMLFLLSIGLNGQVSTQTNEQKEGNESVEKPIKRSVVEMPVFPGCEKIDPKELKVMQRCMQQNLSNLLTEKLDKYNDEMEELGLSSLRTQVGFVVSNQGKIIQIEVKEGKNQSFNDAVKAAMIEISNELKPFKPAVFNEGVIAAMAFVIPIAFEFKDSEIDLSEFNEMVIVSFKEGELIYELRQDKAFQLKAYEVNQGKTTFLGNYISMSEFVTTDPFFEIYQRDPQKLMVSEKLINGVNYRIYYSNLTSNYLDLYAIEGDEEVFLESLSSDRVEFSRLFLNILYRK